MPSPLYISSLATKYVNKYYYPYLTNLEVEAQRI